MSKMPRDWELSKALESFQLYDNVEDEDNSIMKKAIVQSLEALIEDVRQDRVGGVSLIVFSTPKNNRVVGSLNIALMPNALLSNLLGSLQTFIGEMSMKYIQSLFMAPRNPPNPQDLN